ncbi:CHAT domain-containing protein [Streptomyces sp. NPDC051105]|uniref:CHAT domain-containing protein n=1 Tax=Streptomyces sp. NPDC051105 TaxID=3154843 RepID=UPI00344A6D26
MTERKDRERLLTDLGKRLTLAMRSGDASELFDPACAEDIGLVRALTVGVRPGTGFEVDVAAAHLAAWACFVRARALESVPGAAERAAVQEHALGLGLAVHLHGVSGWTLPPLYDLLLDAVLAQRPDAADLGDLEDVYDQLTGTLFGVWQETEAMDALAGTIGLWRGALRYARPGPRRTACLTGLGTVLHAAAASTGAMAQLGEAAEALSEAAASAAGDDGNRGIALNNLGQVHVTRAELHPGGTGLDDAVTAFRRAAGAAEPGSHDRALRLSNLGAALLRRAERDGGTADVRAAVDARRAAVGEAPPDDPFRAEWLTGLAEALRALGERGDDGAAGEALDVHEEALAARPPDPDGPPLILGLGLLAAQLAGRTGAVADVDRAIRLLRTALRELDDDSEALRDVHISLGEMLSRRHGHSPDRQALDEAIGLLRATEPSRSPHRLDSSRIILGQALYQSFLDDGDETALDEAVELLDAALPADAHPDEHPGPRLTLVHALRARHGRTRDPADLDHAIAHCRVAVRIAAVRDPSGGPDRVPGLLLAAMVVSRYTGWFDWDGPPGPDLPPGGFFALAPEGRTGDPALLHEALDVLRPTAPPGNADGAGPDDDGRRTALVSLLTGLLCRQYDRTGDRTALDASVAALERELPAGLGDAPEPGLRTGLADALKRRYELDGDPADFERARALLQAAVDRKPPGSTRLDDIHARIHLGTILMSRGIRAGDLAASDEAVTVLRTALAELPSDTEPMIRSWCADSLGNALLERHERADDDEALDEALRSYRIAVDHTDDPESRPARLSNLGNALTRRYERTGDTEALREGVDRLMEAVRLTGDGHPEAAGHRHNLGGALFRLAEFSADPEIAQRAVAVLREGAELAPADSMLRSKLLSTLGSALRTWSELSGGFDRLAEAVDIHERAAAAMAADDPDRHAQWVSAAGARVDHAARTADPAALDESIERLRELAEQIPRTSAWAAVRFTLGEALRIRLNYQDSAEDRAEALRHYRAAYDTPTAAPPARARAAVSAGRLALRCGDVPAAGEDFARAVELLDEVAWRGLGRPDRERLLSEFGGVACDAAACAIAQGHADRAVELLEHGRGVLLAQTLDATSSLDVLRSAHPALADTYAELTRELERPSEAGSGDVHGTARRTAAQDAGAWAELARRREEVLCEIRALPGQEGFQRPPALPDLLTVGREGPVVLVNVSELRCDALVVTADTVTAVPLPTLTRSAVNRRTDLFLQAVGTAADTTADDHLLTVAEREILGTLAWLWTAVAEPVLTAIGCTEPAAADRPAPRLWWCPTGLLTLLPLHAAGPYAEDGTGTGALDLVVSSYTPTLRALVHSRRARAPRSPANRAPLVVALPTTPGARPLAGARRELEQLKKLRPDGRYLVGPDAVVEQVVELVAAHPWVHFACHGEQDRNKPGEGALRLYDGPLPLRRIARLDLADADLAYASACSTSGGGPPLADECLTVANALVLAGYRHVVGTLWEMTDASGPRVAATVYDTLTSGGSADLDSGRCPYALHAAVRELRSRRPAHPAAWAAHVHVGV